MSRVRTEGGQTRMSRVPDGIGPVTVNVTSARKSASPWARSAHLAAEHASTRAVMRVWTGGGTGNAPASRVTGGVTVKFAAVSARTARATENCEAFAAP